LSLGAALPRTTIKKSEKRMAIADHSETFGRGPVGFLLVHGLGGTPVEMRFVAIGLAQAGYTVSCPQLAGHCGSFEDLRATGWRDWYATVENAHAALRKTCKTVIVGGLSAGAVLALHLAAQRPGDVHGAALFAPTLRLDGWGVPWYSVLFNLVRHRRMADLITFSERHPYGIKDPRVRALVMAAIGSGDSSKAGQLSNPGRVMLEMRWLVDTVKRQLGGIRQPTLILHPREDDRASLRNAAHLQRSLGGMVETCVLDDSYHIVTVDRQRDLVVQRTAAFARSITEKPALDMADELADIAELERIA
jgi:carboxylesterase